MPLACPHDSSALSIRETGGHIGHLCEGCQGVWLPRDFIRSLQHLRKFSPEKFFASLAAQPNFRSPLACPRGCGTLYRKTVKGIDIDHCPACQGIWFDRGEIEMLLQNYPHRGDGGSGSDAVDLADVAGSLLDLFNI